MVKVLLNKHQTELESQMQALIENHGLPDLMQVCEYGVSICIVAVWRGYKIDVV